MAAALSMQRTPNIIRGLLLACICIIALGTGYNKIIQVKGSTSKSNGDPVEVLTFKQMIAKKAVDEYDRWHVNAVLRETDADAIPILKEYWKLGVIPVTEQNLQNSSWQYRHPWSAVFISHVMLQAGAGNNFPYSNNHAKYIVWARDNALAQQESLFAAYDINDQRSVWPEPGDLICMNRRSNQFTMKSINQKCISHCDIIVEVNREKGFITTIGGNVGQTVNKRIVWVDANGFIDVSKNWQVMDEEDGNPEGSQREIFGIIKVNNNYH
jgi:hypothetical protein